MTRTFLTTFMAHIASNQEMQMVVGAQQGIKTIYREFDGQTRGRAASHTLSQDNIPGSLHGAILGSHQAFTRTPTGSTGSTGCARYGTLSDIVSHATRSSRGTSSKGSCTIDLETKSSSDYSGLDGPVRPSHRKVHRKG